MALTVTLAHPDGDLVMSGDPTDDGLTVVSVARPQRAWRRNRVSSDWLHGAPQTNAVLDVTQIDLTVTAKADTSADLDAYRDELEAAAFQWSYDLTVTEDGVAKTYSCDAADIKWNDHDAGMSAGHVSTASLTIPCHPIPGA